jgi:hypothetical protein
VTNQKTRVTVTSTVTSWSTVYNYVTPPASYVETLYQIYTITQLTTVVVEVEVRGGQAKMAKRTFIGKETGAIHIAERTSKEELTNLKQAPELLTTTILSSPNFDLVEHRLQEMGLLVKRVSSVTSTVYTTGSLILFCFY